MAFSADIHLAVKDYRFLLDRGYSVKSSVKLVGDRYQLSRRERSILYRGVSPGNEAISRKEKKSGTFYGNTIYIDLYNVLFTLINYLNGRPVFYADDGFVRDAGELKGRLSDKKLLKKSLEDVFEFLLQYSDRRVHCCVDSPVSNSGKLAALLNDFFMENYLPGTAQTYRSADHFLIHNSTSIDLVCTGDSIIINNVKCPVFDIPEKILTSFYSANIPVI